MKKFLLFLLLWPAAVHGQESVTAGGLTIDEAIAQGIANSRRLAELDARAEAADYSITARRVSERPNVSAQSG